MDADDDADFGALSRAVAFATRKEIDLLMLPYEIETVKKLGASRIVRGMFVKDAALFKGVGKLKDNASSTSSQRAFKAAAFGLINYPWNRLVKSQLLRDHDVFFGPTPVHNDVQYHWHTIAVARNVQFFDEPVITHRKFETRNQTTTLQGDARTTVVDAVLMTHRVLKSVTFYGDADRMHVAIWERFVEALFAWATKLVTPGDLMREYKRRAASTLRLIRRSSQ